MSEVVTTDELLDAGEARTGLTRAQLVRMVGKSAAIRHIAGHEHREQFVLKGGSLLTHVYGSPRQSIADADYVHLEPDTVKSPDLDDAFTVNEGGFAMSAVFRYEYEKGFKGRAVFEIEGVEITTRDRKTRELNVTISIRRGEWLDPSDKPLVYRDHLLAGESTFEVQGLTIAELSAEKVLAWCSKDLSKHLVDVAYVEREHGAGLDYERVADLVGKKFAIEKNDYRYRALGLTSVRQLGTRFTDADRLRNLLHRDWARVATDELFFLPGEQTHGEGERLTEAVNVERLALAYWSKLAPYLS